MQYKLLCFPFGHLGTILALPSRVARIRLPPQRPPGRSRLHLLAWAAAGIAAPAAGRLLHPSGARLQLPDCSCLRCRRSCPACAGAPPPPPDPCLLPAPAALPDCYPTSDAGSDARAAHAEAPAAAHAPSSSSPAQPSSPPAAAESTSSSSSPSPPAPPAAAPAALTAATSCSPLPTSTNSHRPGHRKKHPCRPQPPPTLPRLPLGCSPSPHAQAMHP